MNQPRARFRYRTPSGDEIEIANVDQLSKRIAKGVIDEDTPLYDAGTGQWNRAGDVSVFQFVLEELGDKGASDPASKGRGDPAGDPEDDFEFDLTDPADDPAQGPEARSASPGGMESDASDDDLPLVPDPFGPEAERAGRIGTPKTPDDSGSEGEESGPPGELETGPPAPPPRDPGPPGGIVFGDPPPSRSQPTSQEASPRTGSPSRSDRPDGGADSWPGIGGTDRRADDRTVEGFEEDLSGSVGIGQTRPDNDDPIRSRPPPGSAGRDRGRVRRRQGHPIPMSGLLAAGVVVLLLAGGAWWLLNGSGSGASQGPQANAPTNELTQVPEPAGPDSPFPPELEGALTALMVSELGRLVDSVRVDFDVPAAPPGEWLSGRYLSTASEYPEMPLFWGAYEGLMEELLAVDSTLYLRAARHTLLPEADDPAASELAGLEGFDETDLLERVESRYGLVADERRDRYQQLRQTARAAILLHEFLVEHEAGIEHSPVRGGGVSRDPILEAATNAPETRRGMERHLDDVFRSLDRSRQGGAPSLAGLRVELFERFIRPI